MISIYRRIFIFLLFGSITVLFGQSTNNCILEGKVIDSTTGKPLQLVNVYLSGTTFGASTSQTGNYIMENIPGGSYQLIFQHIGYEIISKDIRVEDNQRYKIDVQVFPKIYDTENIQVTTTDPTEWRNQLKIFIKEFIGESQNADNCEILNPEVLNFQLDQDSKEFIAVTDSIVRIKNRSLGYQINLVLVDFRCQNYLLSHYLIYPKFELLEARNEEEQEQWVENRQNAYQFSFKHFLSTLARGKIMEENFKLSKSYDLNWLKAGNAFFLRGDSLKIKDTDTPRYKKFYLDEEDYLMVSYSKGWIYPSSIIKFKRDYIVIDTLGNVLTPDHVKTTGEWYKARVADILPMEYILTD